LWSYLPIFCCLPFPVPDPNTASWGPACRLFSVSPMQATPPAPAILPPNDSAGSYIKYSWLESHTHPHTAQLPPSYLKCSLDSHCSAASQCKYPATPLGGVATLFVLLPRQSLARGKCGSLSLSLLVLWKTSRRAVSTSSVRGKTITRRATRRLARRAGPLKPVAAAGGLR
jgi:hypothetical protein